MISLWFSDMPLGVLAFRCGPWRRLHELAAYACFWDLGRTHLEDMCRSVGIDIPGGSDLVGLLWKMVQSITGADDKTTLDILHTRLCHMKSANFMSKEVTLLDEALDNLDEPDKRAAISVQKTAHALVEATQAFQNSYVKKARTVKDAGAGDKEPPLNKCRKKQLFKESFDDLFDIPQRDANKYLPSGASIWRSVTGRSGWNGHFPPNPRVSAPFGDGATTCRTALADVLERLWDQFLLKHGKDRSFCKFDFALV